MDNNKKQRDLERRILNNNGWKAVHGLKKNSAFKWVWIFPGRKKAYSRRDALKLTLNGKI